jgi:valyl-tRNA synthetase
VRTNIHIVTALVKINSVTFHTTLPEHIGFASTGMVATLKVMIPMPQELMLAEKSRLEKEKEKTALMLEKMRAQLENKEFVDKAPAALIDKQRDTLLQTENKLKEIDTKLLSL